MGGRQGLGWQGFGLGGVFAYAGVWGWGGFGWGGVPGCLGRFRQVWGGHGFQNG